MAWSNLTERHFFDLQTVNAHPPTTQRQRTLYNALLTEDRDNGDKEYNARRDTEDGVKGDERKTANQFVSLFRWSKEVALNVLVKDRSIAELFHPSESYIAALPALLR